MRRPTRPGGTGGTDVCDPIIPESGPLSPTPKLWLDTTCAKTLCEARVEQVGCNLSIEATGCVLTTEESRWTASLQPGGAFEVQSNPSFGECAQTEAWPDAALSFECTMPMSSRGCRFDLYASSPPTLKAESLELLSYVCPGPDQTQRDFGASVHRYTAFEGCVSGLAVKDGSIALVRHSGYRNLGCTSALSSELVLIDPASMRIDRVTPAPCVSALAVHRGQLVGIAKTGGGWGLVGFDEQGMQVSFSEVPEPELPDDSHPIALVEDAERGRVLAVFSDGEKGTAGQVAVFDEELTHMRTVQTSSGALRGVALLRPGVLAIGDKQGEGFMVVRLEETPSSYRVRVHTDRFLSNNPTHLSYHPTKDLLVISTSGSSPAIWSVADVPDFNEMQQMGAVFYEAFGYPWASQVAPFDEDYMLVGVGLDYDAPARVVLYDLEQNRYLPNSAEVGAGVVSRMVSVGMDVYALLPWSGQLAKISAF